MKEKTDKSREILSPIDFVNYVLEDKLQFFIDVDTAILCFDSNLFNNYITKTFKGREINKLSGKTILFKNLVFGGNFGIGAPAVGSFMEELIACGIKKFICFGSAGTLVERISIGDVVICSESLSDEGTSKHYFPEATNTFPAPNLTDFLFDKLQSVTQISKVKSWTTDGVYRETQAKLDYFSELGAEVVEMEASALNTIAKFREVEVAHVFVISDSLLGGKWQPQFKSLSSKKLYKEIISIFINLS